MVNSACGSLLYPITRNNRPAGLVNIIDNTEWEEYRERVEQTKERRHEIMRAIAHDLEDATPADYREPQPASPGPPVVRDDR